MVKKRFALILSLFLLVIGFLSLWTVPRAYASPALKPRLVILDLPGLDLKKLSTNYPSLEHLVSTGSTGLVRIPFTPVTGNSSLFIECAMEGVLNKGPVKPIVSGKTIQRSGRPPEMAVMINGDDFIDFKDDTPKAGRGGGLPHRFKTGAETILKYYRRYQDQAAVILISFSGLRQPLGRFHDNVVSRVSEETDFRNTILMIYSSTPPERLTFLNSSLTPVVLKGLNFTKGILYAPSTRKGGILTQNDLRGMIRGFLDPKTQAVFPVKNIPGTWRAVAHNQHALLQNYVVRWPLLTFYGYLLLGAVLLFIGGFFFRGRRVFIRALAWGFLYLLTLPATFLLEALFDPLDWLYIAWLTFLISGGLFLFSYLLAGKDVRKTLLFISFLTVGVVGVDGLLNGYYEHKSFLGYSVVAGARYYGIGNEYMGILLGSYIVGVSLILERLKPNSASNLKTRQNKDRPNSANKPDSANFSLFFAESRFKSRRREVLWFAAFFIGLILIHPYFGADVGGGITALMGLGITNFLWLQQPIRFHRGALLGLFTLAIFILMGILDLYVYQSSMSHLGKLLLAVQKSGIGVFIALAVRKISLNLRLIGSTPVSLILIGILLAIPFLYRFPPRPMKGFIEEHPQISSGFAGLSITAVIGLLTNDSGIVSAAMTFLFGIGLIMILIIPSK